MVSPGRRRGEGVGGGDGGYLVRVEMAVELVQLGTDHLIPTFRVLCEIESRPFLSFMLRVPNL